MQIGIPREIKAQEGRVAFLPRHVAALVRAGHEVFVEKGAGLLSAASDQAYSDAGATIVADGPEVYARAALVAKVKEILEPEFGLLRPGHIIFTNIHAALNRPQLDRMLEVGLTAFSAENTHRHGSPNCALAGEVGALEAVRLTLSPAGGTGRHFMAHFGEPAAKAVVLGLGHVGRGALRTLLGLGVRTVGLDIDPGARKAAALDHHKDPLTVGDIGELGEHLADADMIINCVLWPKHRSDHLLSREMIRALRPGTVVVDISCDTAGAVETSRATSWADPVYVQENIRHFCVDNIPGAVPVTASAGYGQAILPHVLSIATRGVAGAVAADPWLARGLTCAGGELLLEEAGRYQQRPFVPVAQWLERQGA
ncbi:NAD(P)-dependent oxidoreductase [Desulfocurvus sp.]|jgi:alanine dehydrogenase|uniref:alanine dehydrogenase n=1 Tax=Desulfocurvus sp. TaxID=2871698 RepID=UPI0025BF86D2|nr:NAD(P)-dependent oxidoreductase [Desulfocurvus sp.]MCK9239086.1 hypothetical protein [Desulfocurvus sp.]